MAQSSQPKPKPAVEEHEPYFRPEPFHAIPHQRTTVLEQMYEYYGQF